MLSLIKNKLGAIGFLIFLTGTVTHFTFDYFYKINLTPLASISFFAASALWTIDSELKKDPTRNWFIYLIVILTLTVISIAIFIYK